MIVIGLDEFPSNILRDLLGLGDRPALCHEPRKVI
jgi:hypothetical protein